MNMSTKEYITAILNKFRVKIQEKFYNKEEIDDKLTTIDSIIITVNNEAVHDNRNTLDKFSEDIDGNPLYSGKKIGTVIEDFAVTDAEADLAITEVWNEVGI